MVDADGRSKRALGKATGYGENYVQQILKDDKEPSFTRLAKVLSVLGPRATIYVISGALNDTGAQLRSALLAHGVDHTDLPAVMKAISGFVSETDDGQSPPDRPHDQPESASLHRAKSP
ncbi:helix-turn-helix domain-containing protein [Shinella sp. JR1-6]|uniref:helix-turn-helix domain-containing protein n=1 Tax=Shinella sp. JR1-6 TaxID=2527671 RepID=UPI00352FA621